MKRFFKVLTGTVAAGAFITSMLALARRQIGLKNILKAGRESDQTSCMVLVIIAGATLPGNFLAVTRLPFHLATWVAELPLPPWAIMGVLSSYIWRAVAL